MAAIREDPEVSPGEIQAKIAIMAIIQEMNMSEQDTSIKKLVEDFLAAPKPGTSLEIPNVGRLEHLPGRRLSYLKYRTGELRVWEIPDPHELSIVGIIQEHLSKLYMR